MRPDNRFILVVLVVVALTVMGLRQHHAYAKWRNAVDICVEASKGRSDTDDYYRACMKSYGEVY